MHGYEARYWLEAKDYIMGKPLKLVASGKYKLNDKSSMQYMLELGKQPHGIAKYTHKMDEHWTVSAKQSYDMNNQDGKNYRLAMDIAYQL